MPILNRDSSGKFVSKNRVIIKVTLLAVFVATSIYMLTELLLAINDWSYKNEIITQTPIIFQKPVYLKHREPEQVLSPVVGEIMDSVAPMSNLTDIDRLLMGTWGIEEYKVARAIAKCESGLRSDAVNWDSKDVGLMQINWPIWEKPIKEKFGYTLKDMFDPIKNVEVAYWIWDRGNGTEGDKIGSWNAWVAKTTKCFVAEL